MRRLLLGLPIALISPAHADVFGVPPPFLTRQVAQPSTVTSYTGPSDIIATWSFYYGARAFSSATRGNKLWNVCDAPNTTCADVVSDVSTGYPVLGTIGATNCASLTTCTIKTYYDLTGNGHDQTTTTAADRFTLNPSAVGGHACGVAAGGTTGYPTTPGSGTTVNQPYTYAAVANRTGNLTTGQYIFVSSGGNPAQLIFNGTPAAAIFSGSGGVSVSQAATDNAPHTILGMANGVSSKISVDGAAATTGDSGTGTPITDTGIGKYAGGGNNFVGIFCEGGLAPGDQSANASTLSTNQHTAYGF